MSHYVPGIESEELPKTRYGHQKFSLIVLVIAVGNIAGTLTGPDTLARIPLQNILKNSLHTSRLDTAKFFFFCSLFFYLKPFAGILTDAFPLFGTRRRHYILFSSVLAALGWVVLNFLPKTYTLMLDGVILINLFVMMLSTVTGAFLVEVGQSRGEVGKLSAARQITRGTFGFFQGPLGGFLAGLPFAIISCVGAVCALSIFPVAHFFLKEEPTVSKSGDGIRNAKRQLKTILKSKPYWLSLSFIFLIQFTPGLGTLMYFRQNDVLHLNQQTIGYLAVPGAIAGMTSSFVYFFAAKYLKLRQSMVIAVLATAGASLGYLLYNSLPMAFIIEFVNGLAGGFTFVVLLDTAARGTPAGCEGLGYAFLMSVSNVAGGAADWLGSAIADDYHVPWTEMVLLNAGTTLLVLLLLPFLPKKMAEGRDSEKPNLENSGEPEEA